MMTRERELLQQALDALESLFTMKVDADRAKKCGDAVVAIRAHLAAQPAPVPLTEGRITAIANELAFGGGHCNVYELARAIEAAHGITGGKP